MVLLYLPSKVVSPSAYKTCHGGRAPSLAVTFQASKRLVAFSRIRHSELGQNGLSVRRAPNQQTRLRPCRTKFVGCIASAVFLLHAFRRHATHPQNIYIISTEIPVCTPYTNILQNLREHSMKAAPATPLALHSALHRINRNQRGAVGRTHVVLAEF